MRIVLDVDLCQGHGVCESEAPEVFRLGKRAPVEVLDEHPPDELRAKVDLAVTYCPTRAIRVEEDP